MSNASSKVASKTTQKAVVAWESWLGVLFTVFLFFVAQIAAVVIVSIYPILKGWPEDRSSIWLTSAITAQFFAIFLTGFFSLGGLHLFLKRFKATFRTIGLRRPRWSDLGYGLGGLPIYYLLFLVATILATALWPDLNVDQKQELGFDTSAVIGPLAMLLTFISLVVIPPIVEEIMVRGMLYSSFKKALPLIPAALITSALFAAAHLTASSDGPLYIAAIDTFALSLVLIYLRELTGGLWACIVLHALKNGIAFYVLYIHR